MKYTLIGSIAVVVWGVFLPLGRFVQDQIGTWRSLGIIFLITGLLSLARQGGRVAVSRSVWRNSMTYLRWALFVLHEGILLISIGAVSIENLPVLLLINYLWPTAIIMCSILFAGVSIHRVWAFALGTGLVVGSLSWELLAGHHHARIDASNSIDLLCYAATFVGAICWGLYCAISRRCGDAAGGAQVLPLFQLTLGAALLVSLLSQYDHAWNLTANGAAALTFMCISQCVAYLCWDIGIRLGNIVVVSLCADFIPWLSLAAAAILLGVPLSLRTVCTAALLVIGAILTRYGTLQGNTASDESA